MAFLTNLEKIKIKGILKLIENTLRLDQKEISYLLQNESLLNICYPTAAGKGYIMIYDIFRRILETDEKILVISSHRLMLNSQHLDDMFLTLVNLVGSIGFIFVGSDNYNHPFTELSNTDNNKILFETKLRQKGLSDRDLIISSTNKNIINNKINDHFSKNRKVIIISTYNSLDKLEGINIDTLYCDEAHTLANNNGECDTKFQTNFNKIKAKNKFFFTATPKDCDNNEKELSFMMNNEAIFGRREGISFKKAVLIGAIVPPKLHICKPKDLNGDYSNSLENQLKLITEAYEAHIIDQKSISPLSNSIEPKILITCPSVNEMWNIYEGIKKLGYNVAAVASETGQINSKIENLVNKHYLFLDNVEYGTDDRSLFLKRIKNIPDSKNLIILHVDIFTEGINIPGITGVMFLKETLPTIIKMMQNIGRGTRLNKKDLNRLFTGEIKPLEFEKMIKPSMSVIIPYWDLITQDISIKMKERVNFLRKEFEWCNYTLSLGTELSKIKIENKLDGQNNSETKYKTKDLINDIDSDIEDINSILYDIQKIEDKDENILLNTETSEIIKDIMKETDLKIKTTKLEKFFNI